MKSETKAWKRVLKDPTFRSFGGIILVIVIVSVLLAIRNPNFMTTSNILNILRQISVYGILAAGMTYIMPFLPAVLVALLVGILVGFINGFVVSHLNVPPFAMTLAMQISLRGLCYIVCEGKPIGNLPQYMQDLGLGSTFGIPTPIYFLLAVLILVWVILSKTTFGRSIYAVGGNPQAAYQAGINSKKVITMVYCVSGMLAAIAGVILAARNASAQPTGGNAFETEAIAACVMGGISMSGGSGSIIGVFFGALLLGIINNGMNLLYIDSYWQMVIKGVIIAGSVIYSIISSKKR